MNSLVVLVLAFVGLSEILFPFAAAYLLSRKLKLSWKFFSLGGLFFILVQIIHSPLVYWLQFQLLDLIGNVPKVAGIAIIAAVLGLLAGIFEEIGRYLVFTRLFPKRNYKLSRDNALMFGTGWGGIESVIVGILIMLTLFSYINAKPLTSGDIASINSTYSGALTGDQAEIIRQQNSALINLTPLEVIPGLLERLMTFTLHIAFTLLVFNSVKANNRLYLWAAVLWHSLVDFSVVFLGQVAGTVAAEGSLFIFALAAGYYIYRSMRA